MRLSSVVVLVCNLLLFVSSSSVRYVGLYSADFFIFESNLVGFICVFRVNVIYSLFLFNL